jgi:hypothetical protein
MEKPFYFLLTLIFCGFQAWGEINEQLHDLSQSSEWRALLHADSSGVSKVRGEKFFLASQGSQDPKAELLATWSAMTSTDLEVSQSSQCRFPARREFLNRKIPQFTTHFKTCPDHVQWFDRLKPERISIAFAAGYLNSAASAFGHTFLIVHRKDVESPLLNYAINFSARTGEEDGALFALKGLFGFYPGQFSMLPYHQLIKDYVNFEGRDLWEYPLDFTQQEIEILFYHLMELEQGYFDYYFIDENCSSLLLELFAAVRPQSVQWEHDPFFTIPVETLKANSKLLGPPQLRPSLQTQMQSSWRELNSKQREWVHKLLKDFKKNSESFSLADQMKKAEAPSVDLIPAMDFVLLWISMREKDEPELKKLGFLIGQQRSQLSHPQLQQKNPIGTVYFFETQDSPLKIHDPSQARLGYLATGDRQALTFSWRPAYHDPLSRHQGLPMGSELRLLDTTVSLSQGAFNENSTFYQSDRSKSHLRLEALEIFSIFNPVAQVGPSSPLTWGILLGVDRRDPEENLKSKAQGRLGVSRYLLSESLLLSALGRLDLRSLENKPSSALGPELTLQAHLNQKQRMAVSLFTSPESLEKYSKLDHEVILSYGIDWGASYQGRLKGLRSFRNGQDYSQFQVELAFEF